MTNFSATNQVRPAVPDASDVARTTALLEALPSAAVLFLRSGTLYAVNTLGRAWFVVDAGAPLSSQSWNSVLLPLGAGWCALLHRVIAGEAPTTYHLSLGGDGRMVDVRAVAFDHELVLLTASHAAAQGARELSTLMDLDPAAVRILDVAGHLHTSNAVADLDYPTRPPVTARELWELEAPHDIANNRPLLFLDSPAMRALGGQMVHRQALAVRRRGVQRIIESYAAPIRDEQQHVIGVVLLDRDVTEQREPLGDARAAERRLSALGQLAAGLMHEVNNALNPIMAAAYLLRHHAESPEAVRDYADRIEQAAEIAAAMGSRVGRFLRQEPVHVGGDEPLDLSALAEEMHDDLEAMLKRRSGDCGAIRVVRQFAPVVRLRGLPDELRAALQHLVENAIDAMPEGGTLTVRTFTEGDDACVAIRDTGTGMSDEVRDRACEPFFTTKGSTHLGLGLAEVYGIARRHRGTATIFPVAESGTEITLRLPSAAPVAVAPVERTATGAPSPVVPANILVVEDHVDGREFLRRVLLADGHRVDAVDTCAAAREKLAAAAAIPYDLLLTDVSLPDGSGWDLARYVRRETPDVRVGVITGWDSMSDTGEMHGAEFVLRKPLRTAELRAHIAGGCPPASSNE